MSASLPSDWFVRLTDEGEDRGKLIFRLQEETFTISAGTLVEVDPEDTALNYGGPYAVRHEGEVLLAAVWPPEGRPKDGPRPMHLRPWGRGLTSMVVPISPEKFADMCIGRVRGRAGDRRNRGARSSRADREMRRQEREQEELAERLRRQSRHQVARKAGWRADPVSSRVPPALSVPDPDRDDLLVPEGQFPIDPIVRRLLDQGRILYEHLNAAEAIRDWHVFAEARSRVFINAKIAADLALHFGAAWPQHRRDTLVIGSRLDQIIEGLDGFTKHIELEDAPFFIGVGEPPAEDDEEPYKWELAAAERAVDEALERARDTRAKLSALREAARPVTYKNDGATDVLAAQFLAWMSVGWHVLTGETPGKSGNGLFHEFCRAAWQMVGWEMPKEAKYFSSRIERGIHLKFL